MFPEISIQLGDVRKLEFKDSSFDGYWSLGVIEHFYNGYDDIMHEMYRVLRPGGVLFLTVPTVSWLRGVKAKFNMYLPWNGDKQKIGNFYQFALDPKTVLSDFEGLGFDSIKTKPFDGFKGLKDEVGFARPIMQYFYDSRNIVARIIKKLVDVFVRRFTSHMTLFILRKK